MASLIHEIENNESLLLMFVSGELPAEDQAEVEQMLANDAGLRAELARIESAYSFATEALSQADEDRSAVAGENHAIRQAKRAMKQWQVDRKNRRPAPTPAAVRHIPSWMYGGAVAALILFGMLTYWGFAGENPGNGNSSGTIARNDDGGEKNLERRDHAEMAANRYKADLLEHSLTHGETQTGIDDAERQASNLVARSDNGSASSILLFDSEQ